MGLAGTSKQTRRIELTKPEHNCDLGADEFARDAGVRQETCTSYVRLSQASSRCQLSKSPGASAGSGQGALPVDHSEGHQSRSGEVLSRQHCNGGGTQNSFTAKCSEEAVSCGKRASEDDGEGVEPRHPVCSVAVSARAAQAQPTELLGELGGPETGGDQGRFKLEQASEALRHGRVMVSTVVLCQVRGQDASHGGLGFFP